MKNLLSGVLVAALVALVGCGGKSTPGGPGATNPTKPIVGQGEDTFTLSTPSSVSLKQGETKTATVGIKRGKNFDQDVALKFNDLPKGLTIEEASPVIKHGDQDAKITLKAADDAGLGDHVVKVSGHPGKGGDATSELKVTVQKK
jgi:hypothetical protein